MSLRTQPIPLAAPALARFACLVAALGVHGAALLAADGHMPRPRPEHMSAVQDPQLEIIAQVATDCAMASDEPSLPAGPSAPESTQPPPRAELRGQSAPRRGSPPRDPGLAVQANVKRASPALGSPVGSPESAPQFAMALSNADPPAARGPASTSDLGEGGLEPGSDAAPLPEDGVSSPARLIGALSVAYPNAARTQDVEADVVVAIVVTKAGMVSDARVPRRAGMGLDEAAVDALRKARFTPAERRGRPVAVRTRWTVRFRLSQ